ARSEPRGRDPRCADYRGGGLSRRARRHLQWAIRAEGDPADDRRAAERGRSRRARQEGRCRSACSARIAGARQLARRVRETSRARNKEMDRRDEASKHQGDRVSSTAAARPFSPKIDRSYPKPKLKLPPGACDTHFHFIGPQKQFPLKPNHVFGHLEFEDTPIEDWLKMQDALGLSRGLHVQSMMYENNYEIALHGQCRFPDRLRAVVAPWPGITDGELDVLTRAGVVGYRITYRL